MKRIPKTRYGIAALILALISLLLWLHLILRLVAPYSNVRNYSGEFRTNKKVAAENFRLAILGDSRRGIETLEAILHDAEGRQVDGAIILGDLVEGGAWAFLHFVRAELGEGFPDLPVLTVVGNHDLDWHKSSKSFEDCFGPDHYWLRAGDRLLVAINNNENQVWPAQLQWLDRTLKEQAVWAREILLFMHKPPQQGPLKHHHLSQNKSEELAAVLGPYQSRTTIFASHIHSNLQEDFGGIPVYINGEAGAPQEISPPVNGYLLLDCSEKKCRVDHLIVPTPLTELYEKYLIVDLFWMWPFLGLVLTLISLRLLIGRKPRAL